MKTIAQNAAHLRVVVQRVVLVVAVSFPCCGVAQEVPGWAGAKVTTTDLLTGETNHGKFAYVQAQVATRAGCHVAKVEGEREKEVFVRRDGRRGKAYEDIAHPVFSHDGNALGYAVRGPGGSRFIINDQEGPIFDEVIPDTFVFSHDGKRHAYLARKAGRLVAVVDGVLQAEAGGDMGPWIQPPVFSADGSSVGYLEGSSLRKQMRVVVNGSLQVVPAGGGAGRCQSQAQFVHAGVAAVAGRNCGRQTTSGGLARPAQEAVHRQPISL